VPSSLAWLFPELSVARLDPERDRRFILARVLERGRMVDVEWCLKRYGRESIRAFFRESAHTEISPRTRRFWRVVLGAQEEPWPEVPSFRRPSAPLFPG